MLKELFKAAVEYGKEHRGEMSQLDLRMMELRNQQQRSKERMNDFLIGNAIRRGDNNALADAIMMRHM